MVKSRETAKPDPPVESEEEEEDESGEEGEEGSSEEVSESESEPENEASQNKAASTPAPATSTATKKPELTASASSSDESEDEESGSDTDSDTETPVKKPDSSIKPIASKPMDDRQKTITTTKKPRSKPNASGPTSPIKSTAGAGAKRAVAAGGDEGKDAKRSKKKAEVEGESSERKGNANDDSKKLFQRLWSEDDEIAILKGMLDYSAKKKADPVADLNAFLEFIKKNIHTDVSRTQLQDKIRRLRKKYENNAEREKKGNKEITFSKPHEQKAYELSKKVWVKEKDGGGEENVECPKANGTAVRKSRSKSLVVAVTPKVDEVEGKLKEVKDLVSEKNVVDGLKNVSFGPDSLRIEEWVLKNGKDLIKDAKKRAELEEKWKELKVKEIELLARRSELMAEQTKLILDGLK